MLIKKYIPIVLILSLFCCILPSCSKEPEDGTIEDVVIDQPVPDEDMDSIFKKADSPYDYEYTNFAIKKAHMRIDVPKKWEVTFVNARYLLIQTPADDGFLPDTTISILCNYGENVDENDMSEYTLNNHAYAFSQYFKKELSGLPSYTGGMKRRLRRYEAEDEIRNGLEFVDKKHAEDAATLVVDDVVLVDKSNNYYTDECGMVSTYVKWDHTPFCFNSVVKKEHLDHAVSMIEYMASSITYAESQPDGYKDVTYKKSFTTSVPNSCMPAESAGNIFISSFKENRESAGIAIGIFTLDSEDAGKDIVTADSINSDYGSKIASLSLEGYAGSAEFNVYTEESSGDDGPDYSGTLLADCSYSDAAEIAGTALGSCGYFLCDFYTVEKNDKCFLISVIYQECQKNIARAAGKTAARKLRA